MVRLQISIELVAVGVRCGACGASACLASASEHRDGQMQAWAAAHHDPRLAHIFSSINGGPVQAHPVIPPRLLHS